MKQLGQIELKVIAQKKQNTKFGLDLLSIEAKLNEREKQITLKENKYKDVFKITKT